MIIGVPSEIKNNEHRVGLTPESVQILTNAGHQIFIQSNAGAEIGFTDELYELSGATIFESAGDVYESSELIIKVKEPLAEELQFLRKGQTLFTYLHLAGNLEQSKKLLDTGVTGIAYETVTGMDGGLPLLAPMSAIAGQLSILVGSYHLLKPNQGRGTLIGHLDPRTVSIIGAGIAGTEAMAKAVANHAQVKVIDLVQSKLDALRALFGTDGIEYILSSPAAISEALSLSDLVIGAVYVVGKQAPKVVSKDMLDHMTPGSVMVDISIDQGGCFETSKPTTHDNPTFLENGILHYCVTNMPGAVPLTASNALNKATLPYIEQLANKGVDQALKTNEHLRNGLNIHAGDIVHPSIKEALEG
jgi:alanine dehydrogenase